MGGEGEEKRKKEGRKVKKENKRKEGHLIEGEGRREERVEESCIPVPRTSTAVHGITGDLLDDKWISCITFSLSLLAVITRTTKMELEEFRGGHIEEIKG